MSKTNIGLVEYAKAQVGKPYWFGTFGNIATYQLLTAKRKQYPKYYNQANYRVNFESQLGQRCHDCAGLIKGYVWSDSPTSVPKYVASQDLGADTMLSRATEKGKIGTIPEIVGLTVHFTGHVGVYIGNGLVVEARGHDYGVVVTELKNRPWTHWCKNPLITYPNNGKVKISNAGATTGVYQVVEDVNVRKKPNGVRVLYADFTDNAKSQIRSLGGNPKNDDFCSGMTITIGKVDGLWGKCPSGWVYLPLCRKIY